MTDGQWVFEYEALKAKEKEERDRATNTMEMATHIAREVLVGVLGLHLFVPPELKGAVAEDGVTPFMPGAYVFGNHHLLAFHSEAQKKAVDEQKVLADKAFDEFSSKLARGETGDMDPILVGSLNLQNSYWNSEAAQQALQILGIKPRPATAPMVPHFGRKKAAPAVGRVTLEDDPEELLYQPGMELEPGLVGGED